MTTGAGITTEDYLAHVRAAVAHLAHAVEVGPLDARIAACPQWDLRALAAHVGFVHRWAEAAARTAARPDVRDPEPPDGADGRALSTWLRQGTIRLVATLRTVDSGAPTWHPFPVPRVVAVWPRRQAHETTIHAWDAEDAAGLPPTIIAPLLAADGVAEYFDLVLPRVVKRDGISLPATPLVVRCTDTGHAWRVRTDADTVVLEPEPRPDADADGDAGLDGDGAATVAGPAAAILGRLWNRPIDDGSLAVSGEATVAEAWLALPGM